MKKVLSIIAFNIFLLVIFYLIAAYLVSRGSFDKVIFEPKHIINLQLSDSDYELPPKDFVRLDKTEEAINLYCNDDRTDFNTSYSGNPVVFLGCSYTYGHGIKKKESFPYLVSEYSHKPVHNYALCGLELVGSLFHIYKYPELKDDVKDAEYAIYLYMYDHVNRYFDHPVEYYDYLFNPGKIEKFLTKSKVLKLLFAKIRFIKLNQEFPKTNEAQKLLKNVFHKSIEEIKTLMPNAKIIFVIYDEKILLEDINDYFRRNVIRYDKDIIKSNLWKELEREEGIEVVSTKDIIGKTIDKDYKLKADIADWHPNSKIWKEFTPEFVNRYLK